jgi:hypothetical protein
MEKLNGEYNLEKAKKKVEELNKHVFKSFDSFIEHKKDCVTIEADIHCLY